MTLIAIKSNLQQTFTSFTIIRENNKVSIFLLCNLISLIVANNHLPNLPKYFAEWLIDIFPLLTIITLKLLRSFSKKAQGKYQ